MATIVAALITVFGGQWAYRRQRNIDEKNQLRQERRRIYQSFMTSISDAAGSSEDVHLRARLEAGFLGSDSVARALGEYNKYCSATGPGTNVSRDPGQYKALLAEVLLAMRDDVFDKTEIPGDQFGELLPIS